MNNKSRIALAIAAALGTAAMGASAQTSTVQIGGALNMFYQNSNGGNANAAGVNKGGPKHDNLSLSEPELWVHGEEKLSADNTAWFRCTSSLDLMGVCALNANSGQWCGRNSGMGMKGSWGNAFVGMWDTPNKILAGEIRGWWGGTGSLTGGFANMLYNGSGNTNNTGSSFYERRARSINYHSPSFSGFSVNASTSASNEQTSQSVAAQQTLNPRTWGLSGQYNNGPLYLGIGYEGHKDFNPAGVGLASVSGVNTAGTAFTTPVASTVGNGAALGYNGGTDTNWSFGARYTFDFGTKLSALYSRSKYDVTNTTELKKNGYAIFVDHQLSGPHSIKAQYYKVGDTKGSAVGGATTVGSYSVATTETGAKGWALAYMYAFSKRTEMGFVYGRISNDLNSTFSRGITTPNAGESQSNYGLNVRHKF